MNEITLFGFNNLTKSLSLSLYKLHYLTSQPDSYNLFIKERYNADKLNIVLTEICHAIGGTVLNIAKQDYQPQGASVTLMISEESQNEPLSTIASESLIAHLDKSHLCIHTYPEESPQDGIAIFRADIELSTCGIILPLKVLNQVVEAFDADVIDIDYRIRGMTRDRQGKKLFTIDEVNNISDFFSAEMKNSYNISEHNFRAQNLFHAKLSRKNITLEEHIFDESTESLPKDEQCSISAKLTREIQQLFTNRN
ncbi:MAG TPA: adenosylmethionine decarboxylase [Colwellia sp.]|nr:adenosylmethionine decarboxylase [Colwellia sp.]